MGNPLTVVCNPLVLTPPPLIEIPHFGILQKATEALDAIPDPLAILGKFQDQLAVAMAPVLRFLQIVEAFMAVKQCIEAVPKALISLDPSVIFDCLKALVKVLAVLFAWVPPFPYIRLALGIANYCIDLVDAISDFIKKLDAKITALLNVHLLALDLGDLELAGFTRCETDRLNAVVRQLLQLLRFIQPINEVLLGMFIKLLGAAGLKSAQEDLERAAAAFTSFEGALTAEDVIGPNPLIPLPPLGELLTGMNMARNAAVLLYNTLAPFGGYESDKLVKDLPTYVNF